MRRAKKNNRITLKFLSIFRFRVTSSISTMISLRSSKQPHIFRGCAESRGTSSNEGTNFLAHLINKKNWRGSGQSARGKVLIWYPQNLSTFSASSQHFGTFSASLMEIWCGDAALSPLSRSRSLQKQILVPVPVKNILVSVPVPAGPGPLCPSLDRLYRD
jgi:hypothetical protein